MKEVVFTTSGGGYWSNLVRNVRVVDMTVPYVNDERDFGELKVYFDTADWDVNEHGLIYTDHGFMEDLRAFLTAHGLPGSDVEYSEQGMQGDDYVSCDVGGEFLTAWEAKFGVVA